MSNPDAHSSSRQSRRRTPRDGFTLMEMIVAIALIAILLPALVFNLFAFSRVWLTSGENDFFSQHVEGVSVFINQSFALSEATAASEEEAESLPVEWARPPGWSDFDDPLLAYRQKEAPALFVREGLALPDINCFLYFEEDEGLSVLWYSELDVEIEDERDLFKTPISPFLRKIEYCYYDREADEWEIQEDPEEEDDGTFILPDYLKLHFEHEGIEETRFIYIPQRSLEMPLF